MSGGIFEDWEFGFLKVSAENLNEHERSQTSKWISDINIETAILLLKNKDYIAAEQKIEYGLGNDNESIQAWNNKGYLLVMRGENADEALLKRDQLIENNPAKLMQAKAEHARWIHMLDKTPEGKSRKRALTILEDVFMRPASDPEPHFLYLKVLSSEVRTSSDSLDKWVDQLEWFADNRIEQDELLIWLEITDVLYVASFDSSQSAKISGALQRISSKLSTQMTLENTAQKLLDLVTKTDEIGPANLYAKVAKSLSRIDFGDQFFDIVEIQEKLQKALKIGEMYRKGNPGRIEMGPKVCGNILLNLWALKYCEKHEKEVRELHALNYPEHMRGQQTEKGMLMFVTYNFYPQREDKELRHLLERAEDHLKIHVEKRTGNWIKEWPRVLGLLGNDREHVEKAFEQDGKYLQDQPRNLIPYNWNLGIYLEHIEDLSAARDYYKKVVEADNPHIPHNLKELVKNARTRVTRLSKMWNEITSKALVQ